MENLVILSSRMAKEPEAHRTEYENQFRIFVASLRVQMEKGGRPQKEFLELVMFLANCSQNYVKSTAFFGQSFDEAAETFNFGGLLLACHTPEFIKMTHVLVRNKMVDAMMTLRNRKAIAIVDTFRTYFVILKTTTDVKLLKKVLTHMVKNLAHDRESQTELQNLVFSHVQAGKDADYPMLRRAVMIIIALFRRKAWTSGKIVNFLSTVLLSPDQKSAAAVAHFFLGTPKKGKDVFMEDSDSEDDDETNLRILAASKVQGAKMTGGKKKKLDRAKKKAKASLNKTPTYRGLEFANICALDMLHDPYALAEVVLERVTQKKEPFKFRLLLVRFLGILISRHQLILLNFYPYIVRFLSVNQENVTDIMAAAALACHNQVPPHELQALVKHIIKTFISDYCTSEVCQTGLNCMREIVVRSPLALTEEQLLDITTMVRKVFKKDKLVLAGLRSIINVYREQAPSMLHRAFRGKEAQLNLSRGESLTPEYGMLEGRQNLVGLDLLVRRKAELAAKAEGVDGSEEEEEDLELELAEEGSEDEDEEDSTEESAEESAEDEEEAGSEPESGSEYETESESEAMPIHPNESVQYKHKRKRIPGQESAVKRRKLREEAALAVQKTRNEALDLATSKILTNEDHKSVRKLQMAHVLDAHFGHKQAEVDLNESNDDSDSDDSEAPQMDELLTGEALAPGKKKSRQKVKAETTKKEDYLEKVNARKGGKSNKEKSRNQPMMMQKNSIRQRNKHQLSVRDKAKNLTKHIKKLQERRGGKQKRRRR